MAYRDNLHTLADKFLSLSEIYSIMSYLTIVFKVLLVLASLVYMIVDLFFIITNTIPSNFILIENLLYVIIYFALFLVLMKDEKRRVVALMTIIIASFNAGRVSESVVDSLGRIHPLAMSHIPLFIGLVVLIIVAFLNIK
ncbi:MAG: hypothetical protein ACP5IZ_08550 [Thermoprotei archaeon]